MKKTQTILLTLIAILSSVPVFGQSEVELTMEQVISLAQRQSIQSMVVRNTFLASYWSFRSFKASRLPSLNFKADVVNFDRSQRALQNYETGEINYKDNYNMYNTGALSIDQNISATGGTISVYSSISRLDQWKPTREITYYTQPITLYYLQPLWTYNSFKWDKKIEPEKYEQAKRQYLESMEGVTINAVSLFYNLLLASMNYELAVTNYNNTRKMYSIANERYLIGKYSKADVLQLELRMINDSLSINNAENYYVSTLTSVKSFLGLNEDENIRLVLPDAVPDLVMDPLFVMDKAFSNSSFMIGQRISELEAESSLERAKGNRGISASLSTQFGLSNNSDRIKRSYSNLLDREIVGLSFRFPIMDWGMGRGRVKVARAQLETTLNRIDQAIIDYRQEVHAQVMQFNSQSRQCRLAQRANDVAEERYLMTIANFSNGTVTVTDLNNAQNEKDEANKNYIRELSNFWSYYFKIRQTALYDFMTGTDISAEYDKLTQ